MADPTPSEAAARLTEIDTALRAAPTSDLQGGDAAQRVALVAEKIRLYPIANPPAADPTAGPTWRERRQHRLESLEMRKEADVYPVGSPTRAEIFAEVADHAAEFQKGDTVPGAFTERDIEQAAETVIPTATDRARFRSAASHAGLTNIEAVQLLHDIRDADPVLLDPIHHHPDGIDLDALWGAEADQKIALVKGLMAKLSATDRDTIAPFVKHIPAVANRVLAIAKRQAGKR